MVESDVDRQEVDPAFRQEERGVGVQRKKTPGHTDMPALDDIVRLVGGFVCVDENGRLREDAARLNVRYCRRVYCTSAWRWAAARSDDADDLLIGVR